MDDVEEMGQIVFKMSQEQVEAMEEEAAALQAEQEKGQEDEVMETDE